MREPVRIFTAVVAAVVAAVGALTASGVLPTSAAVVLTAVSVGLTAAVGEYTLLELSNHIAGKTIEEEEHETH